LRGWSKQTALLASGFEQRNDIFSAEKMNEPVPRQS